MQIRHSESLLFKIFFKQNTLKYGKQSKTFPDRYVQMCRNICLQVFEATSLSVGATHEFGFFHYFFLPSFLNEPVE